MYYVAFDVDGVLLDVGERFRVAEELSKTGVDFWDAFFNEDLTHLDRPKEVIVELIKSKISKYGLIIITGRPIKLYNITLNQLMTFYGIKPARTYMRGPSDYRPSKILKLELIEKALKDGYQIIEYHDDDEEVLKSIKDLHPEITLYLHDNTSYKVYWKGWNHLSR